MPDPHAPEMSVADRQEDRQEPPRRWWESAPGPAPEPGIASPQTGDTAATRATAYYKHSRHRWVSAPVTVPATAIAPPKVTDEAKITERAVAYYRHSAQDRQKNSVEIQSDQVRRWAVERDIEIIHEFADRGKSGLTAEGRPAFIEMMAWVRTRTDFSKILVLDVSRWGRFQDLDLSAQYSSECTRVGKQVTYINLGVDQDDSPIYPLVVTLERYRSAQYSRELSDKVYKGSVKVARQGFRNGGVAPYATQRVMVDEQGAIRQHLEFGQWKCVNNWRIKLIPGNPQQVEAVQFIFHQFANELLDEYQIADQLNARGSLSPGGNPWTPYTVRRVLRNRTYAGAMVYGRSVGKLTQARRRIPRAKWMITDHAFPAIVDLAVFERVRVRLARRRCEMPMPALLEQLQALHGQYGRISEAILTTQDSIRNLKTIKKRFGSVTAALNHLYRAVLDRVRAQVEAAIAARHGKVIRYQNFLVINDAISIRIKLVTPVTNYREPVWVMKPDARTTVDITLGVLLADHESGTIVGYVNLPRLMVPPGTLYFSSTKPGSLGLYGHTTLDFLKEYVQ